MPAVGVSDGLSSAAVTLIGAEGYIAPFKVSDKKTISKFTILAGKTWASNNGLTIADNVTLINNGTLEVSVSNADQLAAAVKAGANKVTMAAGEYALSSQLTINKAITLEGASNGTTTLKRTEAWSGTNNSSKHMVDITASNVTLKNLVIDGNHKETGSTTEGSGINVYKASNVTLDNVISKNNKGCGLIVNGSNVTAKNFHTEGNGYGINLDNGENVTGSPTLSIDANCSVAEESSKIYGPASLLTENSVTVPNGWITTTVTLGKTEYRVWTDKVITTSDNTVFANGYPVTITASENPDKVKIYRTTYPSDFVEVASASAVVYGGSLNASVESTSITMESGKIKTVFGGGYGESSSTLANVTTANIAVHGGEVAYLMVGGGKYYAKTGTVNITMDNSEAIIDEIYAGGYDAGETGNTITTPLNQSNNGVSFPEKR